MRWSFVVARWIGSDLQFLSLPRSGTTSQIPSVLCTVDAMAFKTEIQRRTQQTFRELFGGRLREISKDLVKHIFGFILQEHTSSNGTRYFRISMAIAARVLTHLHDEHDNPNLANWIEYPYSLD